MASFKLVPASIGTMIAILAGASRKGVAHRRGHHPQRDPDTWRYLPC